MDGENTEEAERGRGERLDNSESSCSDLGRPLRRTHSPGFFARLLSIFVTHEEQLMPVMDK